MSVVFYEESKNLKQKQHKLKPLALIQEANFRVP